VTIRAVVLAAAIGAAAPAPVMAQQVAAEALFDRDLTVGSGASITATIGELAGHAEAKAVPDRLFEEGGGLGRTGDITYRLLKFAFFDAPQEHLLLVFDHEMFGHGARLRERFDGPIGYHIQPPAPYGHGNGVTSFVFNREPTLYEQLAISAGGMESTGVVAAIVSEHAFIDRTMQPRDALRYLTFELDTLRYISRTKGNEEAGHDVGDFIRTYNDLAVVAGAPGLTPRRLRNEALISLANPMVAYAGYGIVRYWWNGDTNVAVPALSIAGVRYLPLFRYRLTPFGTEWALVNALGGRMRPTSIELRVGQSPGSTPWGVGINQRDALRWGGWSVDAALDVWQQPPVADQNPRLLSFDQHMGGRIRGRVHRDVVPVWFSSTRASIIIEVGGKSAGYVPGEPLRSGIVARVGIGIPVP